MAENTSLFGTRSSAWRFLMDELMMYPEFSVPRFSPTKTSRRPQEKGRNPYDGLRPWSAITHGIGAVLAVLGTVLLLIRSVTLGLDA